MTTRNVKHRQGVEQYATARKAQASKARALKEYYMECRAYLLERGIVVDPKVKGTEVAVLAARAGFKRLAVTRILTPLEIWTGVQENVNYALPAIARKLGCTQSTLKSEFQARFGTRSWRAVRVLIEKDADRLPRLIDKLKQEGDSTGVPLLDRSHFENVGGFDLDDDEVDFDGN